MICSFRDLRDKEVVNCRDGALLGRVDDIELDTCKAEVLSLIIYGRPRCCGLLGREEDIIICWRDIEVIGEDIILVRCERPERRCRQRARFWSRMFGE